MRNIMYLSFCMLLLLFACASEESASTDASNNAIKATESTTVPAKANERSQQQPNKSNNNKAAEKPNTFNAGQANRLGAQYGKRYCKCIGDGGKKKACEESVIKGMQNMKKALDPRIYKALERAYEGGKSACK